MTSASAARRAASAPGRSEQVPDLGLQIDGVGYYGDEADGADGQQDADHGLLPLALHKDRKFRAGAGAAGEDF